LSEDYYKILGVDKNASQDEIKKSFRELSKKHHPDVGGDESKFKEINEAYSTLSDDKKRSEYDDPLEHMRSNTFDFFGSKFPFSFFTNKRHSENMTMRGKDIRYAVIISLYEAICGIDKEVEYNFEDICNKCEGIGGTNKIKCEICKGTGVITETIRHENMQMVNQSICIKCGGKGFTVKDRCEVCGGVGVVEKNEKIVIKVPPNMTEGSVFRVAGKGTSGKNGGPSGDLLVRLKIKMPKKEDLTKEQLETLKDI